MKKWKSLIITIVVILVIWLILIIVDCIRLKHEKAYTKPLIYVTQQVEKDTVTYVGIGYTITYNQHKDIELNGDAIGIGYGELVTEFKVFGKIVLWEKQY